MIVDLRVDFQLIVKYPFRHSLPVAVALVKSYSMLLANLK